MYAVAGEPHFHGFHHSGLARAQGNKTGPLRVNAAARGKWIENLDYSVTIPSFLSLWVLALAEPWVRL
jgi:hypothetical protein